MPNTMLCRAVYRTIELSDGWTGDIIRIQVYFGECPEVLIVHIEVG